tara:strand:- start:1516 stop:2028 length:513 start_codon:yes stop_codon:yes gene_type:complete
MYLKYVIKNLFLFIFILNLITFSSYSISENIETPIEIANPIFTTKGVNELPYTIKASLGIQQGDDLELFEIEGKIKNRDNIWIYINADKGNYNQISQVVYLLNNVEVYTDEEERLLSDEAIIDIKEDTITLISNVKYNNKDNKIEADRSIITNKFKSFEYFGNVKTKISN